jgi:putative membrane protein
MAADPLAGDPRVALAEERTLLAWIRTGVAMMGFGFVVARFGVFLRDLAVLSPRELPPRTGMSETMGAALVLLGVVVNLAAGLQHLHRIRRLARGESITPRPVFGIAVALVLAAVGVAMVVYLLRLGR